MATGSQVVDVKQEKRYREGTPDETPSEGGNEGDAGEGLRVIGEADADGE